MCRAINQGNPRTSCPDSVGTCGESLTESKPRIDSADFIFTAYFASFCSTRAAEADIEILLESRSSVH